LIESNAKATEGRGRSKKLGKGGASSKTVEEMQRRLIKKPNPFQPQSLERFGELEESRRSLKKRIEDGRRQPGDGPEGGKMN
jgi:hypothetical protein